MKLHLVLAAAAALVLASCVTTTTTYPDGHSTTVTGPDAETVKSVAGTAAELGTKALEARTAEKQVKASAAK